MQWLCGSASPSYPFSTCLTITPSHPATSVNFQMFGVCISFEDIQKYYQYPSPLHGILPRLHFPRVRAKLIFGFSPEAFIQDTIYIIDFLKELEQVVLYHSKKPKRYELFACFFFFFLGLLNPGSQAPEAHTLLVSLCPHAYSQGLYRMSISQALKLPLNHLTTPTLENSTQDSLLS